MAECPFCKVAIEDELARFGGPCPKCFIEIPGDETPTDPGLSKRVEEQLEQERPRPWARVAGVASLAALILVAAGAVVAWRIVQPPGAEALAAKEDQDAFWIAPATEHRLPQLGVVAVQDDAPIPARSNGRGHGAVPITEVGAAGGGGQTRFDFIGTSDEGMPDLAEPAKRTVEVGPGTVGPLSASFPPSTSFTPPQVVISRGSVGSMALRDSEEIHRAVGLALKGYAAQMTTCYERRLKASPDLRGTWEIAFTIMELGSTSNVDVRGLDLEDAEIEQCMGDYIARWTFQPMVEQQDIKKNYTFGPAE